MRSADWGDAHLSVLAVRQKGVVFCIIIHPTVVTTSRDCSRLTVTVLVFKPFCFKFRRDRKFYFWRLGFGKVCSTAVAACGNFYNFLAHNGTRVWAFLFVLEGVGSHR